MYACMHACMDGWMDGCMYVCMYVCMCILLKMQGSLAMQPHWLRTDSANEIDGRKDKVRYDRSTRQASRSGFDSQPRRGDVCAWVSRA